MKPFAIILLLATIAITSCKKEKDEAPASPKTGITYMDSTTNGKNILTMADSTILLNMISYGFGAELEKDAELFIIITNLSPLNTFTGKTSEWFYQNNVGWSVSSYNMSTKTQKFTALIKGKNDLLITFASASGSPGLCRIDFYENSTSITKTKYLKW